MKIALLFDPHVEYRPCSAERTCGRKGEQASIDNVFEANLPVTRL